MIFKFLKSKVKNVKTALAKTQYALGRKIRGIIGHTIDDDTLESLEEAFYEADLGVETSLELTEKVRDIAKQNPGIKGDKILETIEEEITAILSENSKNTLQESEGNEPTVILVAGVNGNGKTTSVAKLANMLKKSGKKVLLGAADTFRAAASEQLEIWAQRLGVDIVKGLPKSDPAAVVFDAIQAAKSRGADVVIIDTAGRLQAKKDLMQELEKIRRSCKKLIPNAPHETLLILDTTTGQNAIDQAEVFHKFVPLTGLVLTKLDGTAKGGIAIAIHRKLGIPIKFICIGEDIEDLEAFDPKAFTKALFAT